MSKERRLGRGLEALLGRPLDQVAEANAATAVAEPVNELSSRIPIDTIERNPYQPRREFDASEIDSLAKSLQDHGLLQPVAVRKLGGKYQLIAGERRLRAARQAGWTSVPAQVLECDDRQLAEFAIVENLQRKDLNAVEKAESFQQYLDRYGCSKEELATRLHMDRSTVANIIRLLELPKQVQQMVRSGSLSLGHARALLPLGDEEEQVEFAHRICNEGWSVRATESQVQQVIEQEDDPVQQAVAATAVRPKRTADEQVVSLEQGLKASLGTKVELKVGRRQKGKIVIHFANHAEFERLRAQICGQATTPRAHVG